PVPAPLSYLSPYPHHRNLPPFPTRRSSDLKVAEPPDPLNGDKIAWQRTAMTESIERRNSGAHERRGLGGIERFGHASQRFNRRDHEFLIAPVITNSANLPIHTVGEITPPARGARA